MMTERSRIAEIGKLAFKTILTIAVVVVAVYIGKRYVGEYLQVWTKLFIEKFGLLGLFWDVYLVDTLIVPLTPDLFLIILITSGTRQLVGLALISVASVLGGISGFGIGRFLGDFRLVKKLVARYEDKGTRLFERYGIWAVIIAAFTPLPFSTICWLAGIFKMRFDYFVLASLFRIPRMVIWYLLIALGWLY